MKDDLKEKRVGSELYLSNVLGYQPLASNDAPKKNGLDSLYPNPIDLQQTRPSNLQTMGLMLLSKRCILDEMS
jgi:hypothetical protein